MKNPLFPGITPIADLFHDFGMYRSIVTPGRGSRLDKPDHYRFVSAPHCIKNGIPLFGHSWHHVSYFLCGNPTLKLLNAANLCCFAGDVTNFRLIPWKHEGKALLVASDRTMIPDIWCAFVSLEDVPDLPLPEGVEPT